jgi:hypothetical protein
MTLTTNEAAAALVAKAVSANITARAQNSGRRLLPAQTSAQGLKFAPCSSP